MDSTIKTQNYYQRTHNPDQIMARLIEIGVTVKEFEINPADFEAWVNMFPEMYQQYKPSETAIIQKLLEHYISYNLLDMKPGYMFIDVAAQASPWAESLRRKNINAYRLDLCYEQGVITDNIDIGADAADTKLQPNSVNSLALHCAFECFEKNADWQFILEAQRILTPGGRLCIIPLYLDNDSFIMSSDVDHLERELGFAPVARTDKWKAPYSRHYSPEAFAHRILSKIKNSTATVYRCANIEQLKAKYPGQLIYCHFTFLMEKT